MGDKKGALSPLKIMTIILRPLHEMVLRLKMAKISPIVVGKLGNS